MVQPFNRVLSERVWLPTAKKDPRAAPKAAVRKVSSTVSMGGGDGRGASPGGWQCWEPGHTQGQSKQEASPFSQSNSTCARVCVHACAPACLCACVFICSANIYWEYHCPGTRVTAVNVWLRATCLLPSGASLSSGVNDSRGQCCEGGSQEASNPKILRPSSAKFLCYRTSMGVSTHPPICLSIIFIYLPIYLSFYTIWENNALASDLFFQCVVTGRRVTLVKFLRLSDIVFGNRK